MGETRRGLSARGWGNLLVHVSVRSKLGQHGSRQVGARCDVPGGKVLVQAILRDPFTIDQAAGYVALVVPEGHEFDAWHEWPPAAPDE